MSLKVIIVCATWIAVYCSLTDDIFFLETFDKEQDVFRTKWTKSQDPKVCFYHAPSKLYVNV